MAHQFVTIKTLDSNGNNTRNVTLAVYKTECQLLGNLEHLTRVVIDQELVDALEKIIVYQNEGRE
jgi:hypothetical protein